MKRRITFTPEEKESDRQDTLQMLRQGVYQNEIARQLGRSYQYISNIKTELINNGDITQEEIDRAKENKHIEDKEKKSSNKITAKEKEIERLDKLNRVYEEIKNGDSSTIQISKKLQIPVTTLNRYINELIEQGKITKGDIKLKKDEDRVQTSSRNASILADIESGEYTVKEIACKYNTTSSNISQIKKRSKEGKTNSPTTYTRKHDIDPNVKLTYIEKEAKKWILQGYQYSYIAKKLGITEYDLSQIVKSLRKIHAINSELINKAREEKRAHDDELIIKYIKQGLSQNEISKKLEDEQVGNISRILDRLKQENRITDKEIQDAANDKIDQLKALVLNGMRKGLIMKEIVDSDESGYATESRVRRMIKTLEESGIISEKSYKIAIKKRKEKKKNKDTSKENAKMDEEIYNLMKKGAKPDEIAHFLDLPLYLVRRRSAKICKSSNITIKDLNEYRDKRKTYFEEKKEKSKREIEIDARFPSLKIFFELERDEVKYGHDLSDEDLNILGTGLVLSDSLLSKQNLELVIMQYIGQKKYSEVQELVKKLCMLYSDYELGDELRSFRDFINQKLNPPKKTGPIL